MEHRKYHWLYFLLGLFGAWVIVVMLSGCEQATSDSGVGCYKCEPPPPPQICWCDDWIYSDEIICYADIP